MIQLSPHLKVLVAIKAVDFRKGIPSLIALCKSEFEHDPFSGTLFVFRNRSGTSIKLLVYDSQGFWLCQKRFSEGRINWWPKDEDAKLHPLLAQQLSVLIYNGNPLKADFAKEWKRVAGSAR
jgi:transposase